MPAFRQARLATLAVIMAVPMLAATAGAQSKSAAKPDDSRYPIVLTSPKQLEAVGLGLEVHDDLLEGYKPAFDNRCYSYGRAFTVYLMSFSDAFYEPWRRQGFSVESLCLALVSQAQFDPETGKRLPTYIIRDEDRLRRARGRLEREGTRYSPKQREEYLKDVTIDTAELPLAVPPCFRNGTPYLDCNWRYGLTTGVPVQPSTAARWKALGEAIDRRVTTAIKLGLVKERDASAMSPEFEASGYRSYHNHGSPGQFGVEDKELPGSVRIPDKLLDDWSQITWGVTSPHLPHGYGYALIATGELGGGISLSRIAEGKLARPLKPQQSEAALRRWAAGE